MKKAELSFRVGKLSWLKIKCYINIYAGKEWHYTGALLEFFCQFVFISQFQDATRSVEVSECNFLICWSLHIFKNIWVYLHIVLWQNLPSSFICISRATVKSSGWDLNASGCNFSTHKKKSTLYDLHINLTLLNSFLNNPQFLQLPVIVKTVGISTCFIST